MDNTFATFNGSSVPSKKLVVGIDIGTTKIACIVGLMNAQGKVELLGIGKSKSNGVMRGIVMNI